MFYIEGIFSFTFSCPLPPWSNKITFPSQMSWYCKAIFPEKNFLFAPFLSSSCLMDWRANWVFQYYSTLDISQYFLKYFSLSFPIFLFTAFSFPFFVWWIGEQIESLNITSEKPFRIMNLLSSSFKFQCFDYNVSHSLELNHSLKI